LRSTNENQHKPLRSQSNALACNLQGNYRLKDTLWLFGAGASYGCGNGTVFPFIPPLGRDLATRLAESNDFWKFVVNNYQLDWTNFENSFGELTENNPAALVNGFRPIANFFTQFTISDNSNLYAKLIHKLKKCNNFFYFKL
jgi:hypothetical protein